MDSVKETSVVVKFFSNYDAMSIESNTLICFHHPNVIKFIGIIKCNELLGMVMYGMDMDLRFLMDKEIYDNYIAVCISKQCSSGLHHVHELGILHADIKPENIGVSITMNSAGFVDSVYVVLIDFGSAKIASSLKRGDIIRSTRFYQSPEKRLGIIHFPGDIFELGVVIKEVIYHSIEDTPPWDNKYDTLISDMMNLDFSLRPNSLQLIDRLNDPYHDIQARLWLISSNKYSSNEDLFRLNYDIAEFIQCSDPLDMYPWSLNDRIEFIMINTTSNQSIRSKEWLFFLWFKTFQKLTVDAGDNQCFFLKLTQHFRESSSSSWLTKLLYCMCIDVISKLYFYILDSSVIIKLCEFSAVSACEMRVRNIISRCMSEELFQLCSSMKNWGIRNMDFDSFVGCDSDEN